MALTDNTAVRLSPLDLVGRPSAADQVFAELRHAILSLQIVPGAKLSEVEVAAQMGVSRQPVRDAFYRLAKLGLLSIRPQRATTVTLISREAVMRARFLRTALEVETIRTAADRLSETDIDALRGMIDQQFRAMQADDRLAFHALDDAFHHEICTRAGVGFAWDLIHEMKAHMDRVRMLSLAFASRQAWEDHVAILDAVERRDRVAAADRMRQHLSRISDIYDRIRVDQSDWFAHED
ncbi:MAG TPA: GntR family transcriptional regulator [Paracoccaceae bacterium]|nr:GntR family transcriptional regulator [Paracoccaceae bacterium]HMO70338.1 GntR family transcriptional regulator [Paracoccaceae bacterium]